MSRKEALSEGMREQRRIEVAEATAKLIAKRGFEAVKVREIAQELGCSTHIVSHYFDNKKDLLLCALRHSASRQLQRLKIAIGQNLSIASCLETFLPLDEERSIDAHVWLVFWGQSLNDDEFIAEQRDFGQRWRRLMIGMMKIRGYFEEDTSREMRNEVAQLLQTAIAGVSAHGTLGVWDANEQRAVLGRQVKFALSILKKDNGAVTKPTPPSVRKKQAVPDTAEVADLAEENTRLRRLLVDAMLQFETQTSASNE